MSSGELNPNQVRGYKSTLARENVSEEAKDHARQVLQEYDERNGSKKQSDFGSQAADPEDDDTLLEKEEDGEVPDADDQGNIGFRGERNRVLGGYKATLKRDDVSDEAKEHAQDVLENAGVDTSSL